MIIHFEDEATLAHWTESTVRAHWLAKLPAVFSNFRQRSLAAGFAQWFTDGHDNSQSSPIPDWKMALTVLLGLYPTVMLLSIWASPHFSALGLAVSMLIGNALSVSILQWAVMPGLQRLLEPWLAPRSRLTRNRSLAWTAFVMILLALLVVIFRLISG